MERVKGMIKYLILGIAVVMLGVNVHFSFDGSSTMENVELINSVNAQADPIFCIPYSVKCAETTDGDTVLCFKTDPIIIF